jgi:hypothetical protein
METLPEELGNPWDFDFTKNQELTVEKIIRGCYANPIRAVFKYVKRDVSLVGEEQLFMSIPKGLKDKFDALKLRLYDIDSIKAEERDSFIAKL